MIDNKFTNFQWPILKRTALRMMVQYSCHPVSGISERLAVKLLYFVLALHLFKSQ